MSYTVAQVPQELRIATQAWSYARDSWPSITIDHDRFSGYVAARTNSTDKTVHYDDLYLACACTDGDAKAIAAFESHFAPVVDQVCARFHNQLDHDDIRQTLREKLFVGVGDTPPKISEYRGIGFLENWLRVTAVRHCIDLLRARGVTSDDAGLESIVDPALDPQLALIRSQAVSEFRDAFRTAITRLEPAQRNLLRWRYVDGTSVNHIAALLGIHRVTASERLRAMRQQLLAHTLEHLRSHLHLSADSVDSFIRALGSDLGGATSLLISTSENVL